MGSKFGTHIFKETVKKLVGFKENMHPQEHVDKLTEAHFIVLTNQAQFDWDEAISATFWKFFEHEVGEFIDAFK